MDLAALTVLVFGMLITSSGMTGLFMPELLLDFFCLSGEGRAVLFVMACSQASLAMGMYYILAAVNHNRMFMRRSVPLRIMNFAIFTSMVLLGFAPRQWLLVAGLEFVGALVTGIALGSRRSLKVDPFNTLRIASTILAFMGALVALQPLGIYGSASVFLAVSTPGFIYAYRMFPPLQTP
ncbi:MAG TPA: hypothetical protein DCZ69_04750 [Syntrophobacteraceae bacterium]|nr:hypothetical protein [Syntrophobacteraceae bacterium]